MRTEVLVPDVPLPSLSAPQALPAARPLDTPTDGGDAFAGMLSRAIDAIGTRLHHADAAERDVALGRGSIQRAAIARAEADVEVSIAAAIVDHAARALNAVSQMQV